MNSKLVAQRAVEGSIYVSIGAGVSEATKFFKPAGGALFGAVAYASGKLIAEGLDRFFGNSSIEKVLKLAAEHFGGLVIALGLMMQIGYKISFATSITLTLWMLPLTYAATKVALPLILK